MATNEKGKGAKSTIGVLGVLASIISVWWFALRPRRKQRGE
jgi:cbb3-type cytochrome oxidase subunit 3